MHSCFGLQVRPHRHGIAVGQKFCFNYTQTIVNRTPHEYIRVTYEYIRVAYEYIRVTYGYIRVTCEYIRPHTTKYDKVQVKYECFGATYDDRRVINMNFCLFISFLHVHRSCLAHTRERAQVPHLRVSHASATHVYHSHTRLIVWERPKHSTDQSTDQRNRPISERIMPPIKERNLRR